MIALNADYILCSILDTLISSQMAEIACGCVFCAASCFGWPRCIANYLALPVPFCCNASVSLVFYECSCLLCLLTLVGQLVTAVTLTVKTPDEWRALVPTKNGPNWNAEAAMWAKRSLVILSAILLLVYLFLFIYNNLLLYRGNFERAVKTTVWIWISLVGASVIFFFGIFPSPTIPNVSLRGLVGWYFFPIPSITTDFLFQGCYHSIPLFWLWGQFLPTF